MRTEQTDGRYDDCGADGQMSGWHWYSERIFIDRSLNSPPLLLIQRRSRIDCSKYFRHLLLRLVDVHVLCKHLMVLITIFNTKEGTAITRVSYGDNFMGLFTGTNENAIQ